MTLFQGWIQLRLRCCIEPIHVQPTWTPAVARPSTVPTTVHLLDDQARCSSRHVHPLLTTMDIADIWTTTQRIRSNGCKNNNLLTVVCFLICPSKIDITDWTATESIDPNHRQQFCQQMHIFWTSRLCTSQELLVHHNRHHINSQLFNYLKAGYKWRICSSMMKVHVKGLSPERIGVSNECRYSTSIK